MANYKDLILVSLLIVLVGCSSDEQNSQMFTPQPMQLGSVEYSGWIRSMTRAVLEDDVIVYVSAGGAAPTAYEKVNGNYQVVSGSPQEWTSSSMDVYGFVRDDGLSSVTTPYQIPLTQTTSTNCSFLASNKAAQSYNAESGGSITIAMTQRLAKLEVTVSDAIVGTTQLAVGNGSLLCRGMFNYDGNGNGSWNTSIGNGATINVTECDSDKKFTVYVLPQTPATGSRFFAVSNSASHVSYYALPDGFTGFEAAHVYSCTLIQDMTVASISIDADFNNGTETVETTTSSN